MINLKKDIIEILCCPTCKGELKLDITKENNNEILEGFFTCKKCNIKYKIEEGIPNLLPK
jgi:uncharacterized protein YbaR (Trm112 family)